MKTLMLIVLVVVSGCGKAPADATTSTVVAAPVPSASPTVQAASLSDFQKQWTSNGIVWRIDLSDLAIGTPLNTTFWMSPNANAPSLECSVTVLLTQAADESFKMKFSNGLGPIDTPDIPSGYSTDGCLSPDETWDVASDNEQLTFSNGVVWNGNLDNGTTTWTEY